MVELPQLPSDFDWVAARRKCSIGPIFEALQGQARKNVEAMAVTENGRVVSAIEFTAFDGGFAVMRQGFRHRGVRFHVLTDSISVEDTAGQTLATVTLTLNDRGQCRLLVDGQELDQWQLLKRVLEPLFFPAER